MYTNTQIHDVTFHNYATHLALNSVYEGRALKQYLNHQVKTLLSAAFVMLIAANSLLEGGAFPWKPIYLVFVK